MARLAQLLTKTKAATTATTPATTATKTMLSAAIIIISGKLQLQLAKCFLDASNCDWKLPKCINYTPRWPIKLADLTIVCNALNLLLLLLLQPTVDQWHCDSLTAPPSAVLPPPFLHCASQHSARCVLRTGPEREREWEREGETQNHRIADSLTLADSAGSAPVATAAAVAYCQAIYCLHGTQFVWPPAAASIIKCFLLYNLVALTCV